MFALAVLLCLAVAANCATLVPLDTAEVRSDRVGNNFAYSVRENRGYAAVNPGLVYPYTGLHSGVQTAYVKPVDVNAVPYYAPTVDVNTVAGGLKAVPYYAPTVDLKTVAGGLKAVPYYAPTVDLKTVAGGLKAVPYYAPTVDVKTVAAIPYTTGYEQKTGASVVPLSHSAYTYSAGVVPISYVGGATVGSYAVPYTHSYAYPQQTYAYPQHAYTYPQQGYAYPQQAYAYPQAAYAYNVVKSDKV